MRDSRHVFRIWADALCIDQNNVSERNQQVKHMGQIYQAASHTIIYLGALTPETEFVLLKARTEQIADGEREAVVEVANQEDMGILRRPWFTRAWILQELVMSRDPWVQCGTLRVRWRDLCALLLGKNEQSVPREKALQVLQDMDSARSRGMESSLLDLLVARRGFGAANKRDLVFALLGLTKLDQNFLLELVDYSKSLHEVYTISTVSILRSLEWKGLERVLSLADDGRELVDRPEGLPSWVPDWSSLPLYEAPVPKAKGYIQFSNTSFKRNGNPFEIIDSPPTLLTLGYRIDTIEALSPIFKWSPALLKQFLNMSKLSAWKDLELEYLSLLEELQDSDEVDVKSDTFELFLLKFMSIIRENENNDEFIINNTKDSLWIFSDLEMRSLEGRRCAITVEGCLLIVPPHARPGDEAVYCLDFHPFILRILPQRQPQHPVETVLKRLETLDPHGHLEHLSADPRVTMSKVCYRQLVGRSYFCMIGGFANRMKSRRGRILFGGGSYLTFGIY